MHEPQHSIRKNLAMIPRGARTHLPVVPWILLSVFRRRKTLSVCKLDPTSASLCRWNHRVSHALKHAQVRKTTTSATMVSSGDAMRHIAILPPGRDSTCTQ